MTVRWLRSPWKSHASYYLGVKASGTEFPASTSGGNGPNVSAGVAFGLSSGSAPAMKPVSLVVALSAAGERLSRSAGLQDRNVPHELDVWVPGRTDCYR